MDAADIDGDAQVAALQDRACGCSVWFTVSRRLTRLSAFVRVQANAHAVPALAALLMQGIVM